LNLKLKSNNIMIGYVHFYVDAPI